MLGVSSLDPEWIVSLSRSAISTHFLAFGTPPQFSDLKLGQGIHLRTPSLPAWGRGEDRAFSAGWAEGASFPTFRGCLVEKRGLGAM